VARVARIARIAGMARVAGVPLMRFEHDRLVDKNSRSGISFHR